MSGATIEVWDVEIGELHIELPMGDSGQLMGNIYKAPILSPDGRFMLVIGEGSRLIDLDTTESTGAVSPDFYDSASTFPAMFSGDGKFLALETDVEFSFFL